jgi:hypothetical protein
MSNIENPQLFNFLQTMFQEIPGYTYQQKLDHLSKCECCARHNINKPTIYTFWNDTPFTGNAFTPCNCKCRHAARFICRQYPDVWTPSNHISRPNSPTSITNPEY